MAGQRQFHVKFLARWEEVEVMVVRNDKLNLDPSVLSVGPGYYLDLLHLVRPSSHLVTSHLHWRQSSLLRAGWEVSNKSFLQIRMIS